MRHRITAPLLAHLLITATAAPLVGQAPDRLRYQIDATADLRDGVLRGDAVLLVPYAALWAPSEIRLDLRSAGRDSLGDNRLRVHAVGADPTVRTGVDGDSVLRVQLPRPAAPGDVVRLEIRFTTVVDPDVHETLGYHSFWSYAPGAYWYPDVIAAGGERVRFKDFEVTLSAPADYTVLTSGRLVETGPRVDSSVRSTYRAEHVEGFSLHLGAGFQLTSFQGAGYTVTGLIPADDPETFRRVVELAAEAVEWYRRVYGFFPVEHIGIVPGPRNWAGGFPLPNVFMVHRGALDEEFLRWITAHELGHYYWGLYTLSATDERLDWLNLANGIWIDHLYLARTAGLTVEELWRRPGAGDAYRDYLQAVLENREQRLGITGAAEDALDFDYNSLIRHSKAAIGVYLQSRRLGAERFLELQRVILADYRYRPLPLEEFTARLEAAGAAGAGEFFDEWVRGDARLEYDIAAVDSWPDESGWRHRVEVARVGTVPSDVDVEFVDTDGVRMLQTLKAEGFVDGRTQTAEVQSAAPLQETRLDPSGAIPMWNSSHPDIRRAYLEAMNRADLTEPFLTMAPAYLDLRPEDHRIRFLMARRLFDRGRHDQVVAELGVRRTGAGRNTASCATRYSCRSAILLARSLHAIGATAEANEILAAIRERVGSFGLEGSWGEAREEVQGEPEPD